MSQGRAASAATVLFNLPDYRVLHVVRDQGSGRTVTVETPPGASGPRPDQRGCLCRRFWSDRQLAGLSPGLAAAFALFGGVSLWRIVWDRHLLWDPAA